jgi:hypothetical protein
MHQTTPLASGAITNHDEITVILIEPSDGGGRWRCRRGPGRK